MSTEKTPEGCRKYIWIFLKLYFAVIAPINFNKILEIKSTYYLKFQYITEVENRDRFCQELF